MAASKVLAAILSFAALPLSVAVPRCPDHQFQVRHMVFGCDGTAGNIETNIVKVVVPAGSETQLGWVPRGVRDFQVMVRASVDADLTISDSSTGEMLYEAGPDSHGSHHGVYNGTKFQVTQSHGVPTVETVKFFNATSRNLRVSMKSRSNDSAIVSLGYYYAPWSAGSVAVDEFAFSGMDVPRSASSAPICPWKAEPVGCSPFKQADMEVVALGFSKWLTTMFGSCDEAWGHLAVNFTYSGARVPYFRWRELFNSWPKSDRPATSGMRDEAAAMYKYVTAGGLEANKLHVQRSDWMWTCGLQRMKDLFIQPCCQKLQSAFPNWNQAWWKLEEYATSNGHQRAMNGLWEVCRSLPNAPTGGREELFRFFNSDPNRDMVASDLKFCYPEGPVAVQPTVQPLVVPTASETLANDGAFEQVPTWDDSGKAAWEDDGTGESLQQMGGLPLIPAPGAPITTPFPVITDAPQTTHEIRITQPPMPVISVQGTTMAPGIDAMSATENPNPPAPGVSVHVVPSSPGDDAPARRESMVAPRERAVNTAADSKLASAGCALLSLAVLSGVWMTIKRNKSPRLERENYLESERQEDQESLLESI